MPVLDEQGQAGTYFRKSSRGGVIAEYKQRHDVGPMQQLLRSIKALEERAAAPGRSNATARLATTGRASKMWLEPKIGYTATSADAFLVAFNAVAGMGNSPEASAAP